MIYATVCGLSPFTGKLWRRPRSVCWPVWVSAVAVRGWVRNTAVQAGLAVNSRQHSSTTFCCSVSPDCVSCSHFLLLPTLIHSPFTSVYVNFFLIPHTPTYVPLCMYNRLLSYLPGSKFPCPLPLWLLKVCLCCKRSCVFEPVVPFNTISFIL